MEPLFSLTATDPEGKYKELLLMMMQLLQETLAGYKIGDVFAGDESDVFTISLSATGGLQKTSSAVEIKLKAGTILSTDAGGLDVDLTSLYSEIDDRIDAKAGFEAPTELTLDTNGEITVPGIDKMRYHTVDTFGDAGSDALVKINGGSVGDLLLIEPANDARTVIVTAGTDIYSAPNFSMNGQQDKMLLVCWATDEWHELTRKSSV